MLAQIKTVLEDEGFLVHRQKATPEVPLDQLLIPVEREDGEPFAVQVALLPDPDEDYEYAELLQFYVGVLESVPDDRQDDVRRVLSDINAQLPILGFNLHPEGFVYFRHVLLCPRGERKAAMATIKESLTLVHFLVESCHAAITAAAGADAAGAASD